MVGLTKYVLRVWEISVAIQIVVCGVLFFRGNFRKLPVFTAYVLSNICQAGALYLIYRQFGFSSRVALVIGWLSQCVPQLLRVLAITEVLRLILKPYRGIWGLGWRVLVVAFGAVFSVALIDSWRDRFFAIGLADRGFHLAFGVALVACLLLVHYYSVPIHPSYKALLGGFCFYSCIAVMANTIGMSRWHQGSSNFRDGWQLLTMGAFVAVLVVWGVALRTPLPQAAQPRSSSGAERAYWEMSPQINEHLRRLNERLDQFWKPEAIRQ